MNKQFLFVIAILCAFTTALVVAQDNPAAPTDKTKAILKLCADWDDAYIKKDAAPLEQMLSADYIGIDEDGATTTKADEIALIKSGTYVLHSVEHLETPKVRFYGSTVVVTTHARVNLTYKGETSIVAARATTVCVDQGGGRWQIASWHASKIKPE